MSQTDDSRTKDYEYRRDRDGTEIRIDKETGAMAYSAPDDNCPDCGFGDCRCNAAGGPSERELRIIARSRA